MTTFDELRRMSLFDGLSDEQLAEVAAGGEEVGVGRGELYAREGEPVEHLYIVLEGELRITKLVDGREVVLNTYTPGIFFAEVPLLSGTPFLASGRALVESRLFLIPNPLFRRMLSAYPSFSEAILKTMAGRVQSLQTVAVERRKLDSLGTLAAGLAHELNNPAAASHRAIRELQELLERVHSFGIELARLRLDPERLEALEEAARAGTDAPSERGPLARGDLEEELALWLEQRGLDDAWELADILADSGLGPAKLQAMAEGLPAETLAVVLEYLGAVLGAASLAREAGTGTARVSDLVEAVKVYSHMDRAPLQEIDVNRELESTLTVLGYRLGDGIEVVRDYDEDLPRIAAHGGELNQVWTSLLDNAADAIARRDDGVGRIRLRTACENDSVLVEVSDNGAGIPEGVRDRVFEPFFTTKGVGEGAGLGLDVSYRIVAGRHGGDIRLVSKPGETRFQVRLPVGSEDRGEG